MIGLCRVSGALLVAAWLIGFPGVLVAEAWNGIPSCPANICPTFPSRSIGPAVPSNAPPPMALPVGPALNGFTDYFLKLAYGRTFNTSTALDYATLELSKRLAAYPAVTMCGPATGEVQLAMMASYVFYKEGVIERVKRLNFDDGFELAVVPKGKFTFNPCAVGIKPYLESGAGMSYVSETYRNSGSRWNWSLMAGFGLERRLPGHSIFSLGVQWRHLSNGNMWGKGDELHNSNSGTDMIQGLASFLHRF